MVTIIPQDPEKTESYVKNAGDFNERIKTVNVEPDELQKTFDVVSFFTNILVEEALNVVQRKYELPKNIMVLARHCLNNKYFISTMIKDTNKSKKHLRDHHYHQ